MAQTMTSPAKHSKRQATCAWCGEQFPTIVELIDHADLLHFDPVASGRPTPVPPTAMVADLAPMIRAFADRAPFLNARAGHTRQLVPVAS
jgi:hypothetical protein